MASKRWVKIAWQPRSSGVTEALAISALARATEAESVTGLAKQVLVLGFAKADFPFPAFLDDGAFNQGWLFQHNFQR